MSDEEKQMDLLQPSEKILFFQQKISKVKACMFTWLNQDGKLLSQPMSNQQLDEDANLWFFVSRQGALAHDIEANPVVNVSFAEPADNLYVSASGRARRVDDEAKIRQLWNPLLLLWFPEGTGDAHLELIRVALDRAEYWDGGISRMVQLFEAGASAFSGRRPRSKPAEHGTIYL